MDMECLLWLPADGFGSEPDSGALFSLTEKIAEESDFGLELSVGD